MTAELAPKEVSKRDEAVTEADTCEDALMI
jgi:hypothetical protein